MYGELTEAKKYLDASFGDYSQEINAQRAQAAAMIAIAEQVKRIADALNSIDTVLVNAEGPDGAIKITLDQDLVEAIGFIE